MQYIKVINGVEKKHFIFGEDVDSSDLYKCVMNITDEDIVRYNREVITQSKYEIIVTVIKQYRNDGRRELLNKHTFKNIYNFMEYIKTGFFTTSRDRRLYISLRNNLGMLFPLMMTEEYEEYIVMSDIKLLVHN